MAELLIRLKNNTHVDPVKDRMCYKQGDIVVVKPDGHQWGRAEGLPGFAVIRTDRTVTLMERYLAVYETSRTETRTIPLVDWRLMKARGNYGEFKAMPAEGATKIQKAGPQQKQIKTISLTGLVQRPYTRRKWGLLLGQLPTQKTKALITTGRAVIPFTQLRIALKNKLTGAQA